MLLNYSFAPHRGIMLRIETNTQFTDHNLSLGDFNKQYQALAISLVSTHAHKRTTD